MQPIHRATARTAASAARVYPLAVVLALVLVAVPVTAKAEQDTVTTSSLTGTLHLLQGRGGNVVASVGEDGVLVIDTDYQEMVPQYEAALMDLAGADASPRFIINTHWHFDHVGGNAFWGERGTVIIAHGKVRERMSTRQEMALFGRVLEPSPAPALPVVTFADSLALHFNGDDIEVQHHPAGHTDGDSVVYFTAENVVHMGDLYFRDRFPFVDIGSGGTVSGYVAAVEAVLARVDGSTLIVPGHGDVARRADLERYLGMLKTTTGLVRARLAAGESVESIVAAGLGEEWSDWGSGFIDQAAWIGFIANSP